MIDYFTIALTHGLILVALWRLAGRRDLDVDDPLAAAAADPSAPVEDSDPLRRASDRAGGADRRGRPAHRGPNPDRPTGGRGRRAR